MNILSYNPGHDGAIAYLKDAHLLVSIEAEKNSNYRYSPISSHDVFNVLGELDEMPDVICTGGWWPREARVLIRVACSCRVPWRVEKRRYRRPTASIGKASPLFLVFSRAIAPTLRFRHVKSAERHPCYALVWEGAIGAFYEIDSELNITLLADVLNQPGNRYGSTLRLGRPNLSEECALFSLRGRREAHGLGLIFKSQHAFS